MKNDHFCVTGRWDQATDSSGILKRAIQLCIDLDNASNVRAWTVTDKVGLVFYPHLSTTINPLPSAAGIGSIYAMAFEWLDADYKQPLGKRFERHESDIVPKSTGDGSVLKAWKVHNRCHGVLAVTPTYIYVGK